MDVREQQVTEVPELDSAGAERFQERRHAAGGTAIVQRQAVVGLDEVRADRTAVAGVEKVDRLV